MHKYRTHNCSKLNKSNVGQTVKLSGWVHSKRDHGSLIFIDLRDHFGLTQVVFDCTQINPEDGLLSNADGKITEPSVEAEVFLSLQKIKLESVITVVGEVIARSPEAINPKISTGEIEVKIKPKDLVIESLAEQIPFQINAENENYPEELRLKYRFLDLRRDKTHRVPNG
jgi:aspartyl-tRNA synthetase